MYLMVPMCAMRFMSSVKCVGCSSGMCWVTVCVFLCVYEVRVWEGGRGFMAWMVYVTSVG